MPIQVIEPAHDETCPADCSQQFWRRVDENAQAVVLVLASDGRVLGTFSAYARAYAFAFTSGQLCTLVPQVIDAPEWGSAARH